MKRRPLVVAIEGHDGAGKSYCQQVLARALRQDGKSVSLFGFHDRTYSKSIVRHFTDAGLMNSAAISASMAISFMATFECAMNSGSDYVVFDRYKYTGRLKDYLLNIPESVSKANYSLAGDADILIYLDIQPYAAFERISLTRGISFFETLMLYTQGRELADHQRRYDKGEYSDTFLRDSFLELKAREESYWKTRVCERPECCQIAADRSPGLVANRVIELVQKVL